METILGNRAVTTGKPDRKEEKKEKCVCKEYNLIWGAKVSCEFRKKVVEISKKLGLPQKNYEGANWLMAVMALETGESFSPSIQNSLGYTGLIQFGKSTAEELETTTDKLKKMNAIEQLDYVEKYLNRKKDKYKTLTDVYLSVLYPVACGNGSTYNYIVFDDDSKNLTKKNAYWANPSFHLEENEFTIIEKNGKKIKKTGKNGGKTYVWEITQVIEAFYNKGKKNKITIFNCNIEKKEKKEIDTCFKCRNKYCKETWDVHTNIRILKLHPAIQCFVKRFINEVEEIYNMKIRITDAYRSYAEQDELYKQGRSKGGKIVTKAKGGYSYHNFGLAIDVVEIKNKKANYDVSVTKKIAPIAKKHGLGWGGDWKSFKDYPHFDMTFNKTTEELRDLVKKYGNYKKIPLE